MQEKFSLTSNIDKGNEWNESTASARVPLGGEVLILQAEWESDEWQRWIPESTNFSIESWVCKELLELITKLFSFDLKRSPGTSERDRLWIDESGLFISFNVDKDDTLSSNVFRYNERRYFSKYNTSNSRTAISLIKSLAGWIQVQVKRKSWFDNVN